MLSIVVNNSQVRFYRDMELQSTHQMPRMLTDCLNREGLLIGDGAISLGALRFYPEALRQRGIQELSRRFVSFRCCTTRIATYDAFVCCC
jgi:hypothetical protein